jgi:peptide-methionine (S)-S-oxide reductase
LFPTYRSIKDHTEAVLIEFNPDVVSYEDLLIEWSRMHTPNYKRKTQYKSAIWYLDDEQRTTAEGVLKGIKASSRELVYTDLEPVTRFYRAEEYHQDFMSKQGGGRY